MNFFFLFAVTAPVINAFVVSPLSSSSLELRTDMSLKNDLWGKDGDKNNSGKDGGEMSKALPFVPRPKLLDGSMPGDAGFDPFGFGGNDKAGLMNMREAEIKHCRLAMLAVVGWPIAELLDRPIAESLGLPALLTKSGESPSVLNGGLEKIDLAYWAAIFSLAGIIEIENMKMKEEKGKNYIPGDCNFDPLKLFPQERMAKFDMQLKEIKNGRVAMMAILGFVAQEALYGVPVVQETPVFFTPAF